MDFLWTVLAFLYRKKTVPHIHEKIVNGDNSVPQTSQIVGNQDIVEKNHRLYIKKGTTADLKTCFCGDDIIKYFSRYNWTNLIRKKIMHCFLVNCLLVYTVVLLMKFLVEPLRRVLYTGLQTCIIIHNKAWKSPSLQLSLSR